MTRGLLPTTIQPVPLTEAQRDALPHIVGQVRFNAEKNTWEQQGAEPETNLGWGRELWIPCRNISGQVLNNGDVVFISSATGGTLDVRLAKADAEPTTGATIGIVTQTTIAAGEIGEICAFGSVGGLDTQTPGWAEGDVLYLSPTTAGGLTNTKPTGLDLVKTVGFVGKVGLTSGEVFVIPWIDVGDRPLGTLYTVGNLAELQAALSADVVIKSILFKTNFNLGPDPILEVEGTNYILNGYFPPALSGTITVRPISAPNYTPIIEIVPSGVPLIDGTWDFSGVSGTAVTLKVGQIGTASATITQSGTPATGALLYEKILSGSLSGAGAVQSYWRTGFSPSDVTKDNVGLGNVTNDAQLKRAANDFSTFAEKAAPVSADILIIEDSAASGAKKKVQIGNLPGGGGGVTPGSWVNATLAANMTVRSTARPLRYRSDGIDGVQVEGTATYSTGFSLAGGSSVVLFTLPPGSRPNKDLIIPAEVGYNGSYHKLQAWVRVSSATGAVTLYNADASAISELYDIGLNFRFSLT